MSAAIWAELRRHFKTAITSDDARDKAVAADDWGAMDKADDDWFKAIQGILDGLRQLEAAGALPALATPDQLPRWRMICLAPTHPGSVTAPTHRYATEAEAETAALRLAEEKGREALILAPVRVVAARSSATPTLF